MKYIMMDGSSRETYAEDSIKSQVISNAVAACRRNGLVYYVFKCVTTITPKGATIVDHEEKEIYETITSHGD